MLGRREPGLSGCLLGAAHEVTERVGEPGQRPVVGERQVPGHQSPDALTKAHSRSRWLWMSETSLVSRRATTAAMSIIGSNWRPAISVTTRVLPSGVFVTPAFRAVIRHAMRTT